MAVSGQADKDKNIGNDSKDALNNGDKKLAIITFDDGKERPNNMRQADT